jgi:DNA (cytosine-5)-methyltransferase 1
MLFNGKGRPLRADGLSSTLPASMGGNKTPIVDEENIYGEKLSWVEEHRQHLIEGGKPYEGIAPSRLRRLTIDECLAIQTFPKDYKLWGRQSSLYRQIGNAVPSKLAEAVALTVMEALNSNLGVLKEASKRVGKPPHRRLPTTSIKELPHAKENLI